MKIAYLIFAHDNPQHLNRLINSISSPSSMCFLHIDKKSDLKHFSEINFDSVIISEKRLPVYRGHFSQVEAIIAVMRQALEHPIHFERFVLLSGTDYPLRPTSYIEKFFEQNPTREFISLVKMPNPKVGKPITRLTSFKPTPSMPMYLIERVIRGPLRRIGIIPIRNYKLYLGDLTPYGGAEW